MKILIVDKIHPSFNKCLKEANIDYELNLYEPKSKIHKSISKFDGIVIRSRFVIDKKFIDSCNNLKFIARAGSGMENIDSEYAKKYDIQCINAAEGNSEAVAQHCICLIISLLKNITKSSAEIKSKIWLREKNRGFEINEKTIGIFGYGNVGKKLANYLSLFGCKIIIYDKNKAKYSNVKILQKIYNESDIISLNINYDKSNHHFCDDNFISNFKKNIYIINTSRGKCLSTKDLILNIKKSKVVGAGLDVLEDENSNFELNKNSKDLNFLNKCDKVILTPHVAGLTYESDEKISEILFKKIIKILKQN